MNTKVLGKIASFIALFFITIGHNNLSATPQTSSHINSSIHVLSFNVLAPCWASPSIYSPAISPYLGSQQRRQHTSNFLTSQYDHADVIALQETTENEFNYYKQVLGDKYYSIQAYHDKDYWSSWTYPDTPWEPNGVALFVKKSTFIKTSFRDVTLTQDGNHAAYFEGLWQETGKKVRIASIHLDSELDNNRYQELKALMSMMPIDKDAHDIIAGDFNFDTQTGPLYEVLKENYFIDALHVLKTDEWTHPFVEDNDMNSGIIDHITSRNFSPIEGHVIHSDLWKLYPHDEDKRVIANLLNNGSDHFPLYAILSNK